MTDKEQQKLYDKILATGVSWLGYNHKIHPQLCIIYESKDLQSKFMIELARIYSAYFGQMYIKCNLWQYIKLVYFKKNRFLHWPLRGVFYIETDKFLQELADTFNEPVSIFTDIYNYYWGK